jgi:hypothetical protein
MFGAQNGEKSGIFDLRFFHVFWSSFLMDFNQKWSQNGAKKYKIWHPKSILFRRGSFVGPFGSFWHPSGSILVAFGTLSAPFSIILAPFFVKDHAFRHSFRETSAKNRRHLRQRKSSLHAGLSHPARSGNLP